MTNRSNKLGMLACGPNNACRRAVGQSALGVLPGRPSDVTFPHRLMLSCVDTVRFEGRFERAPAGAISDKPEIDGKGARHGPENQLQVPAHQRVVWPRLLGHLRAVLGGDRAQPPESVTRVEG